MFNHQPFTLQLFIAVLWIRIGFNADLESACFINADSDLRSQTNADTNPGQTLPALKVEFLHEKYFM
jgi:hypothetical protein